jgi:hypothetical protein
MTELLRDLWGFMGERKTFWLAPIIVVMMNSLSSHSWSSLTSN